MTSVLSSRDVDEWVAALKVLAQKLQAVESFLDEQTAKLRWEGKAAEHFKTAMRPIRTDLTAGVRDIDDAITLLQQASTAVGDEGRRLAADETYVFGVLKTKPDPQAFLRSVGWTSPTLPAMGDTQWATLAKEIGKAQAAGAPAAGTQK